ncbi:MAG: hypothetical protein J5612_05310, partial [Paludibacteraceae bacterium]|nr:hypothetical protein [Paludibacteraceae bacterium]
MKKIISLFIGVSLALVSLHAELLLNEHFDRALGTLSSSTWSSGNIPNDSNWHTYSPGSVQFRVVEQQLSRTDYCSQTSGKAVQYTSNHSRDYILFKNALSLVSGTKAYLAF